MVDPPEDTAEPQCLPTGSIGQITRRAPNPRIVAGHMFPDGKLDISIADPDVHVEGTTWHAYYSAAHATAYSDPTPPQLIRHASGTATGAWTVDDVPALDTATDPNAWDHTNTETPSVAIDPDASPDHRYLMLYAGANGGFGYGKPFPGYQIGAAWSADGKTFTRAGTAPVITGAQVYPNTTAALVADPDLVFVDGVYHAFFSSFACLGASCETTHAFGVSHATSTDGVTWTIVEAPITSLLRSSTDLASGGKQPSVVYDTRRCLWELWQVSDLDHEIDAQPVAFNNMVGIWHADSTDAHTWHIDYTRNRDFAWSATEVGEPLGLLTGADIGAADTARLVVYVGFTDQNVPAEFYLPDHSPAGFRPGVMVLNVATRDLP